MQYQISYATDGPMEQLDLYQHLQYQPLPPLVYQPVVWKYTMMEYGALYAMMDLTLM